MSRKDDLYLKDMTHACDKILRFTRGLTREQFVADERTYDAVLRNLEIIGEAAKNISEETKRKSSVVEWRKIGGFRDVVVHEYFGIDQNILWDIVSTKVPDLFTHLKDILN
ncbi:MAG: nucleotidyltransferase [Elusimicrobia bacterium RIFCSPLOWO2_01_FULL_59_12]|nr:MAG: nucleotidyltransferase [Elusimicrobia bacterium RIFCSPLOWO2_01_FULL_59_12]